MDKIKYVKEGLIKYIKPNKLIQIKILEENGWISEKEEKPKSSKKQKEGENNG